MKNGVNFNILYNTFLYHGTNAVFEKPSLRYAKKNTDFGAAFYCTALADQATRWALRKKPGYVNSYRFIVENISLNTLKFDGYTFDWLEFIANCRKGVPHSYDIVEGPVADDRVYNHVDDYINGIITKEQFMSFARYVKPSHQIAFCTKSAIACLKYCGRRVCK